VKFTQQINNLTESLSGKKGLTQGIILVLFKEDGKWKIFDMACNPTNNRNCNKFFQITVEYSGIYMWRSPRGGTMHVDAPSSAGGTQGLRRKLT